MRRSFTHDNALGGLQTSIIDSVDIHELIHAVQANRPGDDDLTDFLANDWGAPMGFPTRCISATVPLRRSTLRLLSLPMGRLPPATG